MQRTETCFGHWQDSGGLAEQAARSVNKFIEKSNFENQTTQIIMRCGCHVYRTTAVVVAAAIASPVGVTGSQQSSAPTAFVWGSNTFTVSWRPPVLLGTSDIVTKEQQPSAINTPPDKRNSRHSGSSSSSSSSALKMNSHGDGKYNIRQCNGGGDYKQVIGSVDYWWGGRRMTPMLPRLFFEHFSETSFVAEMAQAEAVDEPAEIVGFVCGFVSPSLPKEVRVECPTPPTPPTPPIPPSHRTHVPTSD